MEAVKISDSLSQMCGRNYEQFRTGFSAEIRIGCLSNTSLDPLPKFGYLFSESADFTEKSRQVKPTNNAQIYFRFVMSRKI